jgi:HSP20 family protein
VLKGGTNMVRFNLSTRPTSSLLDTFFMDDFFSDRFAPFSSFAGVDVIKNESGYELHVDLPGVNKENIVIDMKDDILSIKVNEQNESETKEKNYVIRQRSARQFSRSFKVAGVQEDNIIASYENGVLKLELPFKEKIEVTRKIEVK